MQKDCSIFRIPSRETAKTPETPNFAVVPATVKTGGEFEYYDELKQISEEIEKCRSRNCWD